MCIKYDSTFTNVVKVDVWAYSCFDWVCCYYLWPLYPSGSSSPWVSALPLVVICSGSLQIHDYLIVQVWCVYSSYALVWSQVTLVEGEKAGGQVSVAWSSLGIDIAEYKPYFSTPKVVEFPTKVTGETAFANFYLPCNVDYVGPSGERPPLLVRSHGTIYFSDGLTLTRLQICRMS